MAERMAQALREVVRAKVSVRDARLQLGRCERELKEVVQAVFDLDEGVVGETNVVSVNGRVFVVDLDLEEGSLAGMLEADYWFLDGAYVRDGRELADCVEGEL